MFLPWLSGVLSTRRWGLPPLVFTSRSSIVPLLEQAKAVLCLTDRPCSVTIFKSSPSAVEPLAIPSNLSSAPFPCAPAGAFSPSLALCGPLCGLFRSRGFGGVLLRSSRGLWPRLAAFSLVSVPCFPGRICGDTILILVPKVSAALKTAAYGCKRGLSCQTKKTPSERTCQASFPRGSLVAGRPSICPVCWNATRKRKTGRGR